MPGRLRKTGLACAVVLTLAGCGGGDDATIPNDHSERMLSLLDAIEAEVQNGNCDEAEEQAATFAETVDQLPEDVDSEVRQGLSEASVQLVDLTRDPTECADGSTSGEDGQAPVEEQPTTVEEEPTTVEEEPDTTTEEEPEDEDQEEQPAAEEPGSEGNGPPLTTPSGNTPGGGESRAPDSGGLEPERAETP